MPSSARSFALLCATIAPVGLALSTPVHAQLVGTAVLETQYRLRGVALTDGKPDLRLELSYDHPSGAYVGASLIGGETSNDGLHALGYAAYLGFAKQTASALTWDLGVNTSQINLYLRVNNLQPSLSQTGTYAQTSDLGSAIYNFHYRANYSEAYGGLSWGSSSVHLYVSPDYLGEDLTAAYLDVTETARPLAHLRLYAHVGALTPVSGSLGHGSDREHFDLAVGTALEMPHAEVQLSWSGIAPQVQYPIGYRQPPSAVIFSVSGFF